jgi:hypothetical protein
MILLRSRGALVPLLAAVILPSALLGFTAAWAWDTLDSARYSSVPTTRVLLSFHAETPVEIPAEGEISQSFVAGRNYLSDVDVVISSDVRRGASPLAFRLLDDRGSILREQEAELPLDKAHHVFVFEAIPDSQGKTYTVVLASPETRRGQSYSAWAGDCDCYPGSLTVNGVRDQSHDLAVELGFNRPGVTIWRELIDRMSQYKPEVFKGASLLLIALAASAFSLILLSNLVYRATASPLAKERVSWAWLAVSIVALTLVIWVTRPYSF